MIAPTSNPWLASLRKLLAFGSGVGIEVGASDLNIAAVRVRPNGAQVPGALTIHRFREQPAAEWGGVYSNFLAKTGAGHVAATVILPRAEITVRQVALPGVAAKDMESALGFQIDSLHPYPEGDVVWGWAPVGDGHSALVGIARRETLESYITLFAEAGVKVAAFTFSAGAMYGGSRILSLPSAGGFAALRETDGEWEVYGESPARGVFSAVLDMSAGRAHALALSELRLDAEMPSLGFPDLLPVPVAAPADADLARNALPYAAALAGACPALAAPVNLLPAAQRQSTSRAIFIPTVALASLILIVTAAMGISGTLENRRYRAALDARIHQAESQAAKVRALDRELAEARRRVLSLDGFRMRSKNDLDTLDELTRILAPPTWLRGLDINRKRVQITGDTEQAAALLKLLDSSGHFQNSEFTTPLARSGSGEIFGIRAERKAAAQ